MAIFIGVLPSGRFAGCFDDVVPLGEEPVEGEVRHREIPGRFARRGSGGEVGGEPLQGMGQRDHVGAHHAGLGGTTSGAIVDATATTGIPRYMASTRDRPSDVHRAVWT